MIGYTEKGNAKRKTVFGAAKKEVQKKLADLLKKKDEGRLAEKDVTVQALLNDYLDNGVRHTTDQGAYGLNRQRADDYLIPALGGVKLDRLTAEHVQRMLADLEAKGHSPDLRKKVGELLRRTLRYGIKPKLLYENVAQEVTRPRVPAEQLQILDEPQVKRLLAVKGRLFPLVLLALDSAARMGELLALEWTDVDLVNGYLSITKTVKTGEKGEARLKDVKTRAGRRRIKLSQRTVAVLAELRKKSPQQLVFYAEGRGKNFGRILYLHRGNVRRSFKKLLRKAGLPDIRFHDLRHTSATLMLLKTKNVKAVSARLGHSDIRVTLNVYAHIMPAMEDELVAAMEGIFS